MLYIYIKPQSFCMNSVDFSANLLSILFLGSLFTTAGAGKLKTVSVSSVKLLRSGGWKGGKGYLLDLFDCPSPSTPKQNLDRKLRGFFVLFFFFSVADSCAHFSALCVSRGTCGWGEGQNTSSSDHKFTNVEAVKWRSFLLTGPELW